MPWVTLQMHLVLLIFAWCAKLIKAAWRRIGLWEGYGGKKVFVPYLPSQGGPHHVIPTLLIIWFLLICAHMTLLWTHLCLNYFSSNKTPGTPRAKSDSFSVVLETSTWWPLWPLTGVGLAIIFANRYRLFLTHGSVTCPHLPPNLPSSSWPVFYGLV